MEATKDRVCDTYELTIALEATLQGLKQCKKRIDEIAILSSLSENKIELLQVVRIEMRGFLCLLLGEESRSIKKYVAFFLFLSAPVIYCFHLSPESCRQIFPSFSGTKQEACHGEKILAGKATQ